jgi:large conductance mechanosensitive channel
MLKGFRDFIIRGNVVDLAIAVVVGAAFTNIVNEFSKDILTPLIGAVGGTPDFSNLVVKINGSKFLVGNFINAVISFLITSGVIYFLVVLPMNRFIARVKKNEKVSPTTKICPECLSTIPLKATRCAFCTSPIKP